MTNVVIPPIPEGFGRAAEKLADTIQHVVDLVAGPARIRAKAQAQADAEAYALVVQAQAMAGAKELESRALMRLRKRETRRQKNIEQISEKAVLELPSSHQISDQPVSEDWTSRFFQECQDISDEQMQQIWPRILAGEVARPGRFAPRTLSIVRDLTRLDAHIFSLLCSFVWNVPRAGPVPLIYDSNFHEAGINFEALTHLTSIGLIEFNSAVEYQTPNAQKEVTCRYFGKSHQLKFNGENEPHLPIGHTLFTMVGEELRGISNAKMNDQHEANVIAMWNRAGWIEVP